LKGKVTIYLFSVSLYGIFRKARHSGDVNSREKTGQAGPEEKIQLDHSVEHGSEEIKNGREAGQDARHMKEAALRDVGDGQLGQMEATRYVMEDVKQVVPVPVQHGGDAGVDGQSYQKDSQSYQKDGQSYQRDGQSYQKDGQSYQKDGQPFQKDGQSYQRDGQPFQKDGQSFQRDGQSYQKDGQSYQKDGQSYQKDGQSYQKDGQSYPKDGQSYQKDDGQSYQKDGQSYPKDGQSYQKDDGQSYQKDDGQSYQKDDSQSYQKDDGQSYQKDDGQSYLKDVQNVEGYDQETNIIQGYAQSGEAGLHLGGKDVDKDVLSIELSTQARHHPRTKVFMSEGFLTICFSHIKHSGIFVLERFLLGGNLLKAF
jgi:hypothetical protein